MKRAFRLARPALTLTLLAALVSANLSLARAARANDTPPSAAALNALFAQRLPDVQGQNRALTPYRGHPLVINFWASWCAPCVKEMPELSAMSREFAAKGVRFIGIAVDSPQNVKQFLSRVKVSYPVYVAGFGGADLAHQLGDGPGSLPYTIALSASGAVEYRKLGAIDSAKLRAALGAS